MKKLFLLLSIVCTLLINAQTKPDTSIKDFRIIKRNIFMGYIHDVYKPSKKDSAKVWTMNGQRISDDKINERLLLFKSSALQYHKSQKGIFVVFSAVMVASLTSLTGYVLYAPDIYANPPRKVPPLGNVLFSISGAGYATMLFVFFKQIHQHNKAIKMYNKEIINLNK